MADDHVERSSPRNTSEATPPHAYDSPESPDMEPPPTPPEEERITSSTDRQSEKADSPVEQSISSTSEQESNNAAGPSDREAAVRLLLETSEARSVERNSPDILSPASPDPEPPSDEPLNLETHRRLDAQAQTKEAGVQVGSSQEMTKHSIKRNVDEEKSDDSNQQFDMEDLSPASKSPESVDYENQPSPTGFSVSVKEQMGSGSDATVDSRASPKLGVVIQEEGSERTGATENVSLESEISSKFDASIPGFGIGATRDVGLKSEFSKPNTSLLGSGAGAVEEVGLKSESSPSKTDSAGIEGSSSASSTPKKVRDTLSPKRKSPAKVEHLQAKRSTPFTSPDSLQVQSDSSMSTLLEELGIEETNNKPGCSRTISGQEQNVEMEESEECKNEEMEQEDNIEVQEIDSQNDQGEVTENVSEMEDSEMENTD